MWILYAVLILLVVSAIGYYLGRLLRPVVKRFTGSPGLETGNNRGLTRIVVTAVAVLFLAIAIILVALS